MSITEKFISNLFYRFNDENDLSDITYTMCNTSDLFLTAFLGFFFPKDSFGEIYLQREYAEGDCRPDFYFEYEGKTYLIECKIWDRSQHFEEYVKRFKIPNTRLGYITNYPMRKDGFVVHTWTELYKHLLKCIPQEESELWNGYLVYLKQVCGIYIIEKPMNLVGMNSLFTFYKSLDDVFVCDNDKYTSIVYDRRKDTNNGGNIFGTPRNGVMGKYFDIKFKHIRMKQSWGWMGVYFNQEQPLVFIEFDYREGWGKPVYDLLLDNLDIIGKGKYFDKPYEYDGAIWFKFNKPERLDSYKTLSKQIEILRSFYFEVLDSVYSLKRDKS